MSYESFVFDESLMHEEDGFNINIPKCIVEFRPHRKWVGEYGFDWVRTGDTNFGSQDIPELAEMKYKDDEARDKADPFRDFAFQNCVGYMPYKEESINAEDSESTKKKKQKETKRK